MDSSETDSVISSVHSNRSPTPSLSIESSDVSNTSGYRSRFPQLPVYPHIEMVNLLLGPENMEAPKEKKKSDVTDILAKIQEKIDEIKSIWEKPIEAFEQQPGRGNHGAEAQKQEKEAQNHQINMQAKIKAEILCHKETQTEEIAENQDNFNYIDDFLQHFAEIPNPYYPNGQLLLHQQPWFQNLQATNPRQAFRIQLISECHHFQQAHCIQLRSLQAEIYQKWQEDIRQRDQLIAQLLQTQKVQNGLFTWNVPKSDEFLGADIYGSTENCQKSPEKHTKDDVFTNGSS